MRAVLTLHHPRLAERYYDSGQWRDETFYTLLAKRAKEQPDAIALVSKSGKVTWANLLSKVDLAAGAFAQKGLQPGDRVSLWMSDRAEVVIAFLACSRVGLACNPSLHRTYTVAEVAELLSRIEASVLITEDGWGADRDNTKLVDAVAEHAGQATVWTPEQLFTFEAPADSRLESDPDSLAYLAFTSGTTGAPKCVMHSANTLLSNARDLVHAWSLNTDAGLLCLSPLSHHIGWVAVGQWLVSGCRMILGTPPVDMTIVDWIVETEATYVMGVPTHAMDILAAQRADDLPRLGDVQVFYMAGAPIPEVVAEAFVAQGIKPQNVYGMTENSSHQFTHPDDDPEIWTGTCGRGGPGYEVSIFNADDADQPAAPGEVGQIAGRGANLMLGYFDNQTDTAKSFNRDGWFLSGDLGALDANGNLTIKGRLKDLIIRGGHNIHPSRIESLALRHPDVSEAAAFPMPDDRLGERACLAVRGPIDPEPLLHHLADAGLSKFDMPEWFVQVDKFPLTPSGKILKRALIEKAEAGEIVPEPVRYVPKESLAS